MKKTSTMIYILIFVLFLFAMPSKAFALTCNVTPLPLNELDTSVTLTIHNAYTTSVNQIEDVQFHCTEADLLPRHISTFTDLGGGAVSFVVPNTQGPAPCWSTSPLRAVLGQPRLELWHKDAVGGGTSLYCDLRDIQIVNAPPVDPCVIQINPNPPNGGQSYSVTASQLPLAAQGATSLQLWRGIEDSNLNLDWQNVGTFNVNGAATQTIPSLSPHDNGNRIRLAIGGSINGINYDPRLWPLGNTSNICNAEFTVGSQPLPPDGTTGRLETTDICNFLANATESNQCRRCVSGELTGSPGTYTALGCIETNPQLFIQKLLQIAIGLAGGIAFVMIGFGGFIIMTSTGNPDRLNNGKEIIISAIAGLLLIIFSTIILRIIGVDILQIPGLR